jgi:hypothetical protein
VFLIALLFLRFSNVDPEQQILYYSSTESAGSGGYLENIFRYAAKQLFQVDFCGQGSRVGFVLEI